MQSLVPQFIMVMEQSTSTFTTSATLKIVYGTFSSRWNPDLCCERVNTYLPHTYLWRQGGKKVRGGMKWCKNKHESRIENIILEKIGPYHQKGGRTKLLSVLFFERFFD